MPEANTVRLHRVLRAPAERIYRAFIDASAMEKWLPPYGFTGKVDRMDATVGGGYHMSFTNFSTGTSHSFSGKYLELVPYTSLTFVERFDDPAMPGDMTTTVVLRPVSVGTEIEITQDNVPMPVEFPYLGWQESLLQLANLVEPEIPDEG